LLEDKNAKKCTWNGINVPVSQKMHE